MAKSLSSFLKSTGKARESLRFKANTEFEQTIKEWVKERNEEAKRIMEETKRNSTGALSSSLEPRIIDNDNGIVVNILADAYWKFIDKGVNGIFNNRGSEYSFRSLGVGKDMQRSFKDFIKNRGIMPREEQSYDSLAYALAVGVKKKGIEGNEFLTTAYNDEAIKELSKRLEKDVVSIFSL